MRQTLEAEAANSTVLLKAEISQKMAHFTEA